MIRLFVSDIDGCLSEPYRPFDLAAIGAIAELARRGSLDGPTPAFTICTGRPYAYTEAVSQALGVRLPVLFEAGAGMFDPERQSIRWHAGLDPASADQLAEVRRFLAVLVKDCGMIVDIGKVSQAGIIGPDPDDVVRKLPHVEQFVAQNCPDLTVSHTAISIDVMAGHVTKREGLQWLGQELGVDPSEMAFIGDTGGDLGGLALVGRSFAPANANPEVREAVQTVTRGSVSRGVLEAYRACVGEAG